MDTNRRGIMVFDYNCKHVRTIEFDAVNHRLFSNPDEMTTNINGDICVIDRMGRPMQTEPITTKVVSLNPTDGKVYPMQLYVIKFFSDLRQVGGFHRVLRFPPPIKLTATI
jgi:hypothetical protein